MSLADTSDGYYDTNGHWVRTKLCFTDCGTRCTCRPPGGMWVIPTKNNKDEDNEMTTRNAQNEENNGS